MAHASATDAAKNHMNRLRAQKAKKKYEDNVALAEMTPEEIKAKEEKRNTKTLKSKIEIMIWDYKQNQLSRLRYPEFRKLLNEYFETLKVNSKEYFEYS